MHIVDNFKDGELLAPQIDNYAVAVNRFNPKEDDFVYKYSELTAEQKAFIYGYAVAIDAIDYYMDSEISDHCESTLEKIEAEIARERLESAQNWMLTGMNEHMVSFGDDNSFGKDDE